MNTSEEVPGRSRPPLGRNIPTLDGLRGIAILLVLVSHFGGILLVFQPQSLLFNLERPLARGWLGVDLFFVLSGFLITGILLDSKKATNFFTSFYARRFLRIFPLYYGFLAFWFLVLPLLAPTVETGVRQRWFWLYLSNWSSAFGHDVAPLTHFWSLAIEEQFYIVWPMLIWSLSTSATVKVCVGAWGGALLFRCVCLLLHVPGEAIHRMTPARIDTLTMGAIIAIIVRDPRALELFARLRPRMWRVVVVATLACVSLSRGLSAWHPLTVTLGYSLMTVLFGLCVFEAVLASGRGSALDRVLGGPFLRAFGKYSYGIYVLHFPIYFWQLQVISEHRTLVRFAQGWGAIVFILGDIAASYGAALVSWNALERHFLRFKDRFAPRMAG